MKIVNKSDFRCYAYFINEESDILFLETSKKLFHQKTGRGTIIEKKLVVVKKREYWT